MTDLGIYLARKSVNKAEVSRRTGISKARMTQLTNNSSTKLTVEEMYRIALSIQVDPCDLLTSICEKIVLPGEK